MAKKCLIPTPKKGLFVQNATHPDIYDLTPDSCADLPFSYFRLSLPRAPYLIAQGAVFVADSHRNNIKVLNTGLRTTKLSTGLVGDIYDPLNKTRSLILFRRVPCANSYNVYLFVGYYPKSLNAVIKKINAL